MGAGVNPASVEEGSPNLTTYSFAHGITPSQDVTINALMDSIYDDFLAKVRAACMSLWCAARACPALPQPSGGATRTLNPELLQVAAGRKMSVEQVRKLAGGRVYTGEQALEVRAVRRGACDLGSWGGL